MIMDEILAFNCSGTQVVPTVLESGVFLRFGSCCGGTCSFVNLINSTPSIPLYQMRFWNSNLD